MTDQPKALPPRRPGAPAPAGGPRPARPAPRPPADSAGSLRLRKMLLLFIVLACVGLGGGIVWKLFGPRGNAKAAIDVDTEFDKSWEASVGASKDIYRIESNVWVKNQELSADDYKEIKGKLEELRSQHDKLKDLLDLLRVRGLADSGSYQKIVPKWVQIKLWILDASDLLDNQKPPEYGGLNIPMWLTTQRILKAQTELSEIKTREKEIVDKNDPAEIKATRKKITDTREAFRAYATKMEELDKYVAEGLARPDLTNREVKELDQLRDDANKARMAVRAAGDLLKAFPE